MFSEDGYQKIKNKTKGQIHFSYIDNYEHRLIQIYIDDNSPAGYNTSDTQIAELSDGF
jgi:hypothetical protein